MLLLAPAWLCVGLTPWHPGAPCDNYNASMPAAELLKGQHLRILELPWVPFAIPPVDNETLWTGYDIDVLNKVQELLGFSYDIVDTGSRVKGETWQQYLRHWVPQGDLMLSYWARSPERLNEFIELNGHVDMATVLIARRAAVASDAHYLSLDRVLSSFHPFSWPLWAAIVGMILMSGCVDYILEDCSAGGSVGTSLYEYCAGSLWGGFDYPKSRRSAVYQIVVAFLLLVTSSTYTCADPVRNIRA